MASSLDIHPSEHKRIAHDLHHNIHKFLDEVKGHAANIEEEIKQLESIDLSTQMDKLIDHAYQEILKLKLGKYDQ